MNRYVEGSTGDQLYKLDQLRAFAEGNEKDLRAILSSLVSKAKQNLELFRKSLLEKDSQMISDLAHKMLPLFQYLEAKYIIETLQQLEDEHYAKEQPEEFWIVSLAAMEHMKNLLEILEQDKLLLNN